MIEGTELEHIYGRYEADPAFDSLRLQCSGIVQGEGALKPDVVFIGEAPGREEDESGRPFIGAAGQMLDELLVSISMSRYGQSRKWQCFITNIVKFRPVANRDPSSEEISASVPYMWDEINFLEPKAVVTLGRYATQALWPEAPAIGDCHGWIRPMEYGMFHMPMYHPAFGIYDRRNRNQLFRDFMALQLELENG